MQLTFILASTGHLLFCLYVLVLRNNNANSQSLTALAFVINPWSPVVWLRTIIYVRKRVGNGKWLILGHISYLLFIFSLPSFLLLSLWKEMPDSRNNIDYGQLLWPKPHPWISTHIDHAHKQTLFMCLSEWSSEKIVSILSLSLNNLVYPGTPKSYVSFKSAFSPLGLFDVMG